MEGLPIVDEHALVDDNRYVADVLADFRVGRAGRECAASRLLFRKRMFRETDETVLEPVFISLSYVQAQYDYLQVRRTERKIGQHQLSLLSLQQAACRPSTTACRWVAQPHRKRAQRVCRARQHSWRMCVSGKHQHDTGSIGTDQ